MPGSPVGPKFTLTRGFANRLLPLLDSPPRE